MPDKRMHRGQHPDDVKLFASGAVAMLRCAVVDFSLLLTKGYGEKASLKLVGDKFSLTARQRLAMLRGACSDEQLDGRSGRRVEFGKAAKRPLAIDGYNVLITIEAALSGGIIFKARDRSCKDLAGLHGTYRKVTETVPALELIGEFLSEIAVTDVLWLLDSPVSNSGRLKTIIAELAQQNQWTWQIQLLANPDAELIRTDRVVASSDGPILDKCKAWLNLADQIIRTKLPNANVIDLAPSPHS